MENSLLEITSVQPDRARWYCDQLERGKVLFFRQVPFDFPQEDRGFLLSQKQTGSRFHKNISYRPAHDILKGVASDSPDRERLHKVIGNFSRQATAFLKQCLAPYAEKVKMDFASFRPLEEKSRDLPLHKRNDLLHVDAFPSRPTRGGRILRVFTNIHPSLERVWLVGERFPRLAQQYALAAGLAGICRSGSNWRGRLRHLLHAARLPVPDRSSYDVFMLHFHDWLKENSRFQSGADKTRLAFPPLATWLVFTDGVPHAALSGQFALEQTFIVPASALAAPEAAPVHILEKLCGRRLA